DQIIGVKGQPNGGVYQFGVPRRDPVNESGTQLAPPGPTGVATAIGFQPTGGGKAAITGDFVLTGDEVNPVIKALRSNGIEVPAVHSPCSTSSRGCSSCTSGPMTTRSSLPRDCALQSTRRRAQRAKRRPSDLMAGPQLLRPGASPPKGQQTIDEYQLRRSSSEAR